MDPAVNQRSLVAVAFLLAALLPGAVPSMAQSAEEWLARSIAYHDPSGLWGRPWRLELAETRPDGPDRSTRLLIAPREERFRWETLRDGHQLVGELDGDLCRTELDGREAITPEERESFRLDCDRVRWLRDYYTFLWGLPMKLRDPGTRLDPVVERVELDGREVVALRVTYDPEVGGDVWILYLDPASAELVAYRFYHDEAANDGELIALDGEVAEDGVRIPRARDWTTHSDARFLGTDILQKLSIEGEDR